MAVDRVFGQVVIILDRDGGSVLLCNGRIGD